MFTKNFYRAFVGKISNCTYTEAGLITAQGNVYSSTNAFGSALSCLECFSYSLSSASSLYMGRLFTKAMSSATGYGGVFFGDGTTPPTLDDINLSGNVITTLNGTAKLSYDISDDGSVEVSALWTLTNTGNVAVTISEAALACGFTNNSFIMFERTLLDTPVTIPAGGIGQVTYTIRFNYPTA